MGFLKKYRQHQKAVLLPSVLSALVLDFDGVMTDNRVLVSENGQESVYCNRDDGLGLKRLQQSGLPLLVLSAEENPVVGVRCRKLQIPFIQGVQNKLVALNLWLEENKLEMDGVVYLGNGINDLECLQTVACGVVVADAHPQVKKIARIVLSSQGGKGAVYELCNLILSFRSIKDVKVFGCKS